MSIADDIIYGNPIDIDAYLAEGNDINDIAEYGFTLLIESAIAQNLAACEELLDRGIDVNKPDVTGRTALHWAVDNQNLSMVRMLLAINANVNAFNRGGQSPLVYPLLRDQWMLKQVLYQHHASLEFALDFINTKLIGHRFELKGDVDIVNAQGEFIELDYEGFFLEFTLDMIRNSLAQFRNNFAARKLRAHFGQLCEIIYGFEVASELLKYQHQRLKPMDLEQRLSQVIGNLILILPIAYKGHAITFIRYGDYWAKCDRGENSLREGSVNIYYIGNQEALTADFFRRLVYQKQTEEFVHHQINQVLGLKHLFTLPLSSQIAGNCSWANVEAVIPTAFMLQLLDGLTVSKEALQENASQAMDVYQQWLTWDKNRALSECINSIPEASAPRKASKLSILGAVLFQSCDYGVERHMQRTERILQILSEPEHRYILDSYIEAYCLRQLTPRGNNLLKLLEDAGIDSGFGVKEIATGLKGDQKRSET